MPASQSARKQGLVDVLRLTEGITRSEVVTILQDAGEAAADRIAFNLSRNTVGAKVTAAQLKMLMEGMEPISRRLWEQIERITASGISDSVALAVDQALYRDAELGMPGYVVRQYAPRMFIDAAQSVESLISRRTNGFTLAQRIYANGTVGVRKAAAIVERELVLQRSAREVAAQVKGLYDPRVPGGQSYAAKRLARTEINNAHHSTSIRHSQDRPWVTGMKWNLSSSHPRSDDCDTFAKENHDGLGEGVYKKGHTPRKPHPQCLCYLSHLQVSEDEFIDNLVTGKYQTWLNKNNVGV